MQDEELLMYLKQDKINIDDVVDYSQYHLLDKEIPALCLDRVDGILATCLFWARTHKFNQIKELYNMLCYFESLEGMNYDYFSERLTNFNGEIVLSEYAVNTDYESFFKAINVYSIILLSKENRYLMQVFGYVLKFFEENNVFDEHDLFNLSEQEIINKMLNSKYRKIWEDFVAVDQVNYADASQNQDLIVYSKPKIRQANPLCLGQMEVCEIHNISGDFYRELNDLSEAIELVSKPLVGNLNHGTAKILSRYNK